KKFQSAKCAGYGAESGEFVCVWHQTWHQQPGRASARTGPRAGPADTAERSSLGNRPSSTGLVVGMAANPEPYWPLSDLHREGAMIAAEPSQTRRARSS